MTKNTNRRLIHRRAVTLLFSPDKIPLSLFPMLTKLLPIIFKINHIPVNSIARLPSKSSWDNFRKYSLTLQTIGPYRLNCK